MGCFVCSSRTTLPAPPSCSVWGWICKLNQQALLPSRWQSVWPMGNPSRKTPSGKQENSEAGCLYLVSSLPGCSGLAVLPSSKVILPVRQPLLQWELLCWGAGHHSLPCSLRPVAPLSCWHLCKWPFMKNVSLASFQCAICLSPGWNSD